MGLEKPSPDPTKTYGSAARSFFHRSSARKCILNPLFEFSKAAAADEKNDCAKKKIIFTNVFLTLNASFIAKMVRIYIC